MDFPLMRSEAEIELMKLMDDEHPGWRDLVTSAAFNAWVMLQPDSEQDQIFGTWNKSKVESYIERFRKEWQVFS